MFCTECGASLAVGSKFCANCGTKVVIQAQASVNAAANVVSEKVSKSQAISDLIESLGSLTGLERVFVGKGIPDKKLKNAISEYAKDVAEADVLLLVDDTLFGNAKNGLLITKSAIYCHQMGMQPQHVKLDELTSVSLDKQKSVCNLMVNGVKMQSIGASQESLAPVVEVLNAFAQKISRTVSEDQPTQAHEQIEIPTLEADPSGVPEAMKEIFFRMEDHLAEKSILFGIAPESMLSVTLSPSFYEDDGAKKIKCTIAIECSEDEDPDDDVVETISDVVSDCFQSDGYKEELDDLGYEDMLDWWPVVFANVNSD